MLHQGQPRIKTYVTVLARTDRAGNLVPLSVEWPDGRTFNVTRVCDVRREYAHGAYVLCFSVKIGGNDAKLYYEQPRWFVEAKTGPRHERPKDEWAEAIGEGAGV